MSKANKLKESIQRENDRINEDITMAKGLANLIPYMEEKKKESEVKITIVDHTPDDILEEIAPQILPYQEFDEQRYYHFPITAIEWSDIYSALYTTTTGTTTAFDAMAASIRNFKNEREDWVLPINDALETLADEKSKKARIPEKLEKINDNLGKMFGQVEANYEKAVNGVMSLNQVAMDIRAVIQQLWGGLANIARKKNPEKFGHIQHLQHKVASHRELVTQCLAKTIPESTKISELFLRLYDLTRDISASDFGKNPLSTDLAKLKEIRRHWIIRIDDLIGLIGDV